MVSDNSQMNSRSFEARVTCTYISVASEISFMYFWRSQAALCRSMYIFQNLGIQILETRLSFPISLRVFNWASNRGKKFCLMMISRVLASTCLVVTQLAIRILYFAWSSLSLNTPTSFKISAFLTASYALKAFFKFGMCLLSAYFSHSLEYPLPSNLICLVCLISERMIESMSCPFSSSAITSLIPLVIIEAITVMLNEGFCFDPTDLNSNLFPVNAKGLVLLRSVLSCKKLTNPGMACSRSLISEKNSSSFSILFRSLSTQLPKKTEMMQGGASWPPIRCQLEGEVTLATNSPAFSSTALRVISMNKTNSLLFLGFNPGSQRFLRASPSLIKIDQLQCLALPLARANGFSWSRTVYP